MVYKNIYKPGFTIVELLVVIVVIGILAAITIASYTGISQKAAVVSLQSDLSNASTQLKMFQVENSNYPATIDCSIPDSPTNKCVKSSSNNTYGAYQINNTVNPQPFCLTVKNDNRSLKISQDGTSSQGVCVDFSAWAVDSGVSYDVSTDQISLIGPGSATSPLIYVNGSSSVTLAAESYATIASPYYSPQSGVLFGSSYYAADGITPAYNTSGYTGNGNAQAIPLSGWTKRTWQTPTGPDVVYMRFRITSSSTNYTSD